MQPVAFPVPSLLTTQVQGLKTEGHRATISCHFLGTYGEWNGAWAQQRTLLLLGSPAIQAELS